MDNDQKSNPYSPPKDESASRNDYGAAVDQVLKAEELEEIQDLDEETGAAQSMRLNVSPKKVLIPNWLFYFVGALVGSTVLILILLR